MPPLPLVLATLVAAAAGAFVALPFLRRPRRAPQAPPSPRLALLERRDRALAALKDLEFDHRTGKISDDDYRMLLAPLRREAAETLRLLEGADATPATRKRSTPKPRRAAAAAKQR